MKEKILLPKLGESITSAVIVRWLKKVGDSIKRDEPLLEVSTDKVNTEVPSPFDGILLEILFIENSEVQVGEVLAFMEIGTVENKNIINGKSDFLSPVVINFAKEHGISISELENIQGSGSSKRVSKKDVEEYIKNRKQDSNSERIKVSPSRKVISDILMRSAKNIPSATLIDEFNVSKVEAYLLREKEKILKSKNIKVTITAFVAWAISRAIKKYPLINSVFDNGDILVKKHVNMGLAVNVDGELVVPIIRDCSMLSLLEIAAKIGDLSKRAREGKIEQEEIKGGTITLTNFGVGGALIGIPIIGSDQGAIIGMGALHKKVVLEGDKLTNRDVIMISLTFDHRLIDGIYGCQFLNEMKRWIEGDGEESF